MVTILENAKLAWEERFGAGHNFAVVVQESLRELLGLEQVPSRIEGVAGVGIPRHEAEVGERSQPNEVADGCAVDFAELGKRANRVGITPLNHRKTREQRRSSGAESDNGDAKRASRWCGSTHGATVR